MVRWRPRWAPGRRAAVPTEDEGAGGEPTRLIDLRDPDDLPDWAAEVAADAKAATELAERFRARAAQRDAQRDLERLRSRYWSGERLLEEARGPMEWWEHPEADPYAVLDLVPGARLEEAGEARRRIAQACHPDRLDLVDPNAVGNDLARRRMVAANAAYDRLRRALRPV